MIIQLDLLRRVAHGRIIDLNAIARVTIRRSSRRGMAELHHCQGFGRVRRRAKRRALVHEREDARGDAPHAFEREFFRSTIRIHGHRDEFTRTRFVHQLVKHPIASEIRPDLRKKLTVRVIHEAQQPFDDMRLEDADLVIHRARSSFGIAGAGSR